MSKKTKLTKNQVLRVAKLADLKLSKKEIEKYRVQLAEVLDYVEILNQLDTSKVEPTAQVTGLVNVVREDKVEKSLSQKQALSGARRKEKGWFKVGKQ